VVGGPHAGFNFQISSLVLGIEGDVTFVDFEDTASAPGPFSSGEPMEAGDHQIGEVDFLASIRARLGWAFDRALVFATGGAALAEADWVTQQHGNRDEVEFNDVGGVAGGGLEWAVTNALSVRAEGLYYFFDDEEGVGHFHSAASSPPFDGPVEFDDAIVGRLGVSWYFGRSPL
jgi:outer membrane immunogenic protein